MTRAIPDGSLAAPATETLLDDATIEQLRDVGRAGSVDFLTHLLDLFDTHAPASLSDLRTATTGRDPDGVGRAAHSLKAMALNVGAAALAGRSAELESAARHARMLPDEERLEAIAGLLDASRIALRGALGSPAGEPL